MAFWSVSSSCCLNQDVHSLVSYASNWMLSTALPRNNCNNLFPQSLSSCFENIQNQKLFKTTLSGLFIVFPFFIVVMQTPWISLACPIQEWNTRVYQQMALTLKRVNSLVSQLMSQASVSQNSFVMKSSNWTANTVLF